jgi:Transcriptional regulator
MRITPLNRFHDCHSKLECVMDMRALRAFLAVSETGSFSLAGERLHLSQPAVSKRIGQLESDLGQRLFDRLPRRVLPTEAGRALLPYARAAVAALEDGQRVLGRLADEPRGPLRFAASHHVGLRRLPGVLSEYGRRHPQVALDLHLMESERACSAVAEGEMELAISTLPDVPVAELATRVLWADALCLVAAAEHPLLVAGGHPSAAQLSSYPAVLPERGTFTRNLIDRALARSGIRANVRMETGNLESLRMLAAAGLGWSLLPESLIETPLRRLRLDGLEARRELGVVQHARRQQSAAAKALIELLVAGPAGAP